MGLTRIRAQQISDIDYKQAVRVITVSNITLSGGAPTVVDGVTLVANDRVLVSGQTTGSQNGLYYVSTLGTGSTGTWTRTSDGNETGEIEAGMIVMVTEGTLYKDTQWKLTTNNPIVLGTTTLTFEQTSAYAFGTVAVSGQTNIVATTVGDTLTLAAGNNISITTASKTATIAVTGISLNSISNGTSNVNVVSSGGNVTVGVAGTGNVAVFASTGEYITGVLSASGNITGGNLITTGLATVTGNITGGNLLTAGLISATGNITGGNILGGANVNATTHTGTTVSVTGNVNGGNLISAALVQGVIVSATGNVVGGNLTTAGLISATGNITGGNLSITSDAVITGNLTVNGTTTTINSNTVTTNDLVINMANNAATAVAANGGGIAVGPTTGAYASLTYNSTANIWTISNGANTPGILSATGNITGGNLLTTGLISATGNITGGNILGNGASLTGISAFSNVTVTAGNSIVANSISSVLTLTGGNGISLIANTTTGAITIQTAATNSIFATGGDMGTTAEAVTSSEDLGLTSDSVTVSYDLGSIVTSGVIYPDALVLPSYTVASLPTATVTGSFVYVSNASGGAIPAFADGTNWRRVDDRSIVT